MEVFKTSKMFDKCEIIKREFYNSYTFNTNDGISLIFHDILKVEKE
jgi:hypothetical protein